VLVQLADETVVASNLAASRRRRVLCVGKRSCSATRRRHASVTVSSLDSGTVKDEEDQQQTDAAFQRGAGVLNCSIEHAGHC
jgi:hypothetical protein